MGLPRTEDGLPAPARDTRRSIRIAGGRVVRFVRVRIRGLRIGIRRMPGR
jgi:hypothetical protein